MFECARSRRRCSPALRSSTTRVLRIRVLTTRSRDNDKICDVAFCLAGPSADAVKQLHAHTIFLLRINRTLHYVPGSQLLDTEYKPLLAKVDNSMTRQTHIRTFTRWTGSPVFVQCEYDDKHGVLRMHWLFMPQSELCQQWSRDKIFTHPGVPLAEALHEKFLTQVHDPKGPSMTWADAFDQALPGV